MDPRAGPVDPKAGQVKLTVGQVDPRVGQVDPRAFPADPKAGHVDPRVGQIRPDSAVFSQIWMYSEYPHRLGGIRPDPQVGQLAVLGQTWLSGDRPFHSVSLGFHNRVSRWKNVG